MPRTVSRDLRLFGVTLAAIFVAELGDKTQLTALAFAANTPGSPWLVFAGAGAAMVASSLLGVLLGDLLARLVKPRTLNTVAGVIFLLCAAFFVGQAFFAPAEEATPSAVAADTAGEPGAASPLAAMMLTFTAIFIAELGDKTQLATLSLAAGNRHARWVVFAGSATALVTASGLAVLLGGVLGDVIHGIAVTLAAAVIFAALGVAFLMGWAEKGRREFAWLVREIEALYRLDRCRHCRRFKTFLEHVRDIGSETVSGKVDELLGPAEDWQNAPDDCTQCSVTDLHANWHEKFEHTDEKPFEEGQSP